MSTSDFYLRYYVGHKGKFGHEFLEFEFRPDGEFIPRDHVVALKLTPLATGQREGRKTRNELPPILPSVSTVQDLKTFGFKLNQPTFPSRSCCKCSMHGLVPNRAKCLNRVE